MPIISPNDKEILASQSLLSPANSEGSIRIHKRRLNRSSDEEYSHLPLPSPLSPASSTASEPDAYSTIPEELVSLATIKYLGYDDESASKIWNEWIAPVPKGQPIPDTDPIFGMPFLDPIVGFSYGRKELDTWDEDDQKWYECMARCGINEDTQVAMMDPIFKDVRLTQSCLFWIRDTIQTRYDALQEVQRASMEREQEIIRASRRPGGSASQRPGGPSTSSRGGSAGTGTGGGYRSISQIIRTAPGISQHTAMSEAVVHAADNAPGSITLYRDMSKSLIDNLFDGDGNVVAIQRLASRPPTDFCSDDSAYYFAVDRDVAIRYACWTKRRTQGAEVVIVHAAIPNACIKKLSGTERLRIYWPSEEWKKLVWICRNDHTFPSGLVKYKRATLVIGTIASKPNREYIKMDSHSQITEKHLLKNRAGGNAVQYVFRNPEGRRLLAENADIKVFPLPTSEYQQWKTAEEDSK